MKKFFLSAISALALVACVEEQANPVEPSKETVTVNFVAGGVDTKTYIDAENNVFWNESGEYLKIFETAGDATLYYDSKEGVVSDDNTTAQFSVELDAKTATGGYVYNAVYPKSAWLAEDDNNKVSNLKLLTPPSQNPTLTSFDPAADLLIAKSISLNAQPKAEDKLDLQFARIVAVGKIAISGLNTTDPVKSVEFIGPDDLKLNGRTSVNLTEGKVIDYGYFGAKNSVKMVYDEALNFTNGNVAIFTCLPCEVPAGKFTVVVSTEAKTYTKECNIPSGESLIFEGGKSTKFSVNMTGATENVIEDFSGTYAIVDKLSAGTYWALKNTTAGSKNDKLTAEQITDLSSVEYTSDASITWIIEKQEDGKYIIKNGSNYLSWNKSPGGNIAGLVLSTELNEGILYQFNITKSGEQYTISVDNDTRHLSRNTTASNKYFAFYTASKAMYLVPAGEDQRTIIAAPTNLKITAGDVNSTVVLDWDDMENANQYVVTYGAKTATVTESNLTIENLEFDKTYTFSVVAKNTDEKQYKASDPSTKEFTTGTAPQLVWPDAATFTAAVADVAKPKDVTLAWTAAENATSYEITWTGGSETVEAPATTAVVTCAAFETEYEFSIVAKADGYKPSAAKTATAKTGEIYAAEVTVEVFNTKEDSNDVWYQLTGVVSDIRGTNYNLTDGTGTVYVYNHSGFYNLGIKDGDTVTIKGNKKTYNSTIEVINAVLVSHTPLPRAEYTGGTVSFDAASPTATELPIAYSESVVVENVSFVFEGTNADKFSATKIEGGVSVVPVGDNETDAEYTATLNVMYESKVLCSIAVSQVAAGDVVKEEVVLYSTGFESNEGFKSGSTYNSTTLNSCGETQHQWGVVYGTPSTTNPISGSQEMQMRLYKNPSTGQYGYAQTAFDLSNVTRVTYKAYAYAGIKINTYYSTDSGTTWTIVDSEKILDAKTNQAAKELEFVVSTIGQNANVRIKFEISTTSSVSSTSRFGIDDVKIYGYN